MATDLFQPFTNPDAMDPHDTAMLTRRSTRSFVEDELDADVRELRQSSADAAKIFESQLSQSQSSQSSQFSQYSDMIAGAGQHGLSVRTNMNMDPSTGALSGTISSRASTVSTAYSSLSTPSSAGDATPAELDEGKRETHPVNFAFFFSFFSFPMNSYN